MACWGINLVGNGETREVGGVYDERKEERRKRSANQAIPFFAHGIFRHFLLRGRRTAYKHISCCKREEREVLERRPKADAGNLLDSPNCTKQRTCTKERKGNQNQCNIIHSTYLLRFAARNPIHILPRRDIV